jgi:GntR family transcriptional repressor for pyruvate dehydrogenase complex
MPAQRGRPARTGEPVRVRDTVSLFKPAKPLRAFEEIIGQIRGLIAAGELGVGDKLPAERVLAAQLEVNRHTVREALRALEISGIVTLKRGAHGGAFIVDPEGDKSVGLLGRSLRFTDVSVADLTQAMRSITMMLLEAAMPVIDEEDLIAIEDNIAAAEAIENPGARSAVIIRFYVQLAEASRNPILVELAESFCEILLSWVVRLGSLSSDRVLASRRSIVASLRKHDRVAAQAELERHLRELHGLWLSGAGETGSHGRA